MKDVVAAIIKHQDKILIAQRSFEDKLSLLWEFPGGKREEGETLEEALVREIKEELELEIKCESFFGESIYNYSDKSIRLIAYWCSLIRGGIRMSVHNDVKWITTEELKNYSFAPADVPIVEELLKIDSLENRF